MWTASGIHARRFGHRRLTSACILLTADRRWTDVHAVAATTRAPSAWSLGVWVLVTGALISVVVGSPFVAGQGMAAPALVAASCALPLAALAVQRRWRARRLAPGDDAAWVLSDVASNPGHRAAAGIVDRIAGDADARGTVIVLAVRSDNGPALDLYRRAGFVPATTRPLPGMVVLRRPPRRALSRTLRRSSSRSARRRPVIDAPALGALIALVVAGWLMALHRDAATAWLVAPAVAVAVPAAFVDVACRRVPNGLTLSGFVATASTVAWLEVSGETVAGGAVLGALIMAGPLFIAHFASSGRTPGLGDVKLAGVLGIACGAIGATVAYVGLLSGLVVGAATGMVVRRRTGQPTFPFAPALALGAVLALALAPTIGASTMPEVLAP